MPDKVRWGVLSTSSFAQRLTIPAMQKSEWCEIRAIASRDRGNAQEVARKLEGEGVSAAVINARFVKPLDVEMVEFYARSVDVILTLEDHVLKGGFGSAVLEEVNNLGLTTPVVRIGWPDRFIEHGKPDALRAKYGITAQAALEKLRPWLRLQDLAEAKMPLPKRAARDSNL